MLFTNDKIFDDAVSESSCTTSVSPRGFVESRKHPKFKSDDERPRSLSFHNIRELPRAEFHLNLQNCITCVRIGSKGPTKFCSLHLKSRSCGKTCNCVYQDELHRTITCNVWDDPFEQKHVYHDPCLSPRAVSGLEYLSRFKPPQGNSSSEFTLKHAKNRKASAPIETGVTKSLIQTKEGAKLKRININERKSKRSIIEITQRLKDLADYVEGKCVHSNSVYKSAYVKKKPSKRLQNEISKQRRVTWDDVNESTKFFDQSEPVDNSYPRQASYKMMTSKYEIKEAPDEAADENGLKISLNLCPSYEEECRTNIDASYKAFTNDESNTNESGSCFSEELLKAKSPKNKRKKRKIRKYTRDLSHLYSQSPCDKIMRKKASEVCQLEDNQLSWNFSFNSGNSNFDKLSQKSPVRGSMDGVHSIVKITKMQKASSDIAKKSDISREQMLKIIEGLRDLDS